MPIDDESIDEDEFYGQEFEKEGVVSLWAELSESDESDNEVDVLQDLCGVGYYSLDNQESNCNDFELLPLVKLLDDLSYSCSFKENVLATASRIGISEARWVIAQYDFAYDPQHVIRPVANDPKFLGVFQYTRE